ncbi:hypothetical protein FMUND_8920 [Fusarium mundagurra]|uniref:Ankyrin repeat protein n=1 Tax=Fusarium mundagurra TaxID=1567541 RepID=A0A8H6DCJ7_9HYPO|nr:hypothetical protein FMUND_8920 [Fusarium mundagurra]
MSSALTTSVFILPLALYKEQTPSAVVIAANPTATTIQLYCPDEVSAACKSSGYNNSIVIGPWASKTVPVGAASTGVFHWMLALNDLGGASSVECLVSSGTPQICTTMALPNITKEFELMFGTLPIVITKGQELLETASQATTTEDPSAAQVTGSETKATSAEVTATSASTDAAAPKTNGVGSSAVRIDVSSRIQLRQLRSAQNQQILNLTHNLMLELSSLAKNKSIRTMSPGQTPEALAWRGRQATMRQQQQNMPPAVVQIVLAQAKRQFDELQRMTPEQRRAGNRMGTPYDDIPISEPNDLMLFNGFSSTQPDFVQFGRACREGDMATVESIVTSQSRTPAFLHEGLFNALGSGKVDIVRYLLESGAPITRITPSWALAAPIDQQKPLFELLLQHGWTVNTPGFYGAVLLPSVIRSGNDDLLDWFLQNGADPNLGKQQDNRDRFGDPETNSCEALETAAAISTVETVQKLLNAGAKVENGAPLYYAAGIYPQGSNPHSGLVTPSKEFDEARIPVMELLVKNGARVNDKLISRHVTAEYPIVNAVMAGAIERVKWLLSQGADPDLKGQFGSARDYAGKLSSDEMKRVLQVV